MNLDIHDSDSLKAAIAELQEKERREKQELVNNFHALKETLKPMNLLKNTFHSVAATPGIGGTLFNTALSLGTGALSKKLLIGSSNSIIKRVAGYAVKAGVTGIVASKANKIKYVGLNLISKMLGKKRPPKVY